MSYVPRWLPCGVEVNKNWRRGMSLECCRTVCPDKSNEDIDACYKRHFDQLKRTLMRSGIRLPKNEVAWFEIKDFYFYSMKKEKKGVDGDGEKQQDTPVAPQ